MPNTKCTFEVKEEAKKHVAAKKDRAGEEPPGEDVPFWPWSLHTSVSFEEYEPRLTASQNKTVEDLHQTAGAR